MLSGIMRRCARLCLRTQVISTASTAEFARPFSVPVRTLMRGYRGDNRELYEEPTCVESKDYDYFCHSCDTYVNDELVITWSREESDHYYGSMTFTICRPCSRRLFREEAARLKRKALVDPAGEVVQQEKCGK